VVSVSAEDVLYDGRFAVEELMVDRVRVERLPASSEKVLNPVTFKYDRPAPTLIYRGRGRVQVRSDINGNAYEAVVGERENTIRTNTVQLPMFPDPEQGDEGSTAAIRANDVLTIEESPLDPSRVGIVLNLQADLKEKTHSIMRRLRGQEVIR
jgi:hypothetical protein